MIFISHHISDFLIVIGIFGIKIILYKNLYFSTAYRGEEVILFYKLNNTLPNRNNLSYMHYENNLL